MKEAAIRVIFEDRRNDIRHEMDGEYAGLMLKDDDGLACLFAGDVSKKDIICAMASFVDSIIGCVAEDEDERKIFGIMFVKALGRAMTAEQAEPEIKISNWKEETE